jgi:hypothetical protein
MNPQAEAANQRNRERRAASCVHFSGYDPDRRCKAGVPYNRLAPRLLPCIPAFDSAKEGQRPTCPHFVALGMEAVLAQDAEDDAFSAKIDIARRAIVEDAKKNHYPVAGAVCVGGVMGKPPCPVCNAGTLRYSIARSNGHIHAGCTTPDCVSWME